MTIKEKNLKLIMELIFIFILPLAVIGINCKLDNQYVYDNEGNFETSQKELVYSGIVYTDYYKNVIDGFNVWNEMWEVGAINYNTGTDYDYSRTIRTVGYTMVTPNEQYYFTVTQLDLHFYDANFSHISARYVNVNSPIVTMPSNCQYIRWMFPATYGTTYKNDMCVNHSLTWANGNYVPYGEPLIINASTNYTGNATLIVSPFVNFKNMVAGAFNVNNTDTSFNIIFDYTCLWFLQFVIWHLLYGLFDFLIHLVSLKKKE